MGIQLKKLKDQVLVITGASSGIGLVTARMAAAAGARVVLVARNEDALKALTEEINSGGGRAIYVVADVGDQQAVAKIGQIARDQFGRIDSWINDAGVSIYGRLEDVPVEDHRRLFETNFWGVVYGSLEAVRFMREEGGALINLGAIASDRAVPLQGMFSASKHAVKGFTDALRMELEQAGVPISVTLIKPSAVDTPYAEHARNYLASAPRTPAPLYAPETVARAILYATEHVERDVIVGGAGKVLSSMSAWAPRLTDKVLERTLFTAQQSDRPARLNGADALYRPGSDLAERGAEERYARERSVYTRARLHPFLTGALVAGAVMALRRSVDWESFLTGSSEEARPLRNRLRRFEERIKKEGERLAAGM
ncbi:MAG: putative oxidoreductase yxnA [Pseudomonadota bacterium]|jgi:short-subunit dehydrogenase